jgi:hypothetical protein
MSLPQSIPEDLVEGRLAETGSLPILFTAVLCDLRPRFLAKGGAGRGYRAVARNGRVLLASDLPVEELAGRIARVRLQIWHKAILPDDPPLPYGVLLCVRQVALLEGETLYQTRLIANTGGLSESPSLLRVAFGGGRSLDVYCQAPAD